jgi:hypothetical protein
MEMQQGDWLAVPSDPDLIFAPIPADLAARPGQDPTTSSNAKNSRPAASKNTPWKPAGRKTLRAIPPEQWSDHPTLL